MHVGLNLIFLVPGETGGMEIAARELIPELLAAAKPGMQFTAFVNREAASMSGPWNELLPAVTVPVRAERREQWVLGEQALLPPLAARAGVDLLHSLASTAPLWGSFRRVVTIHDLIYERYPEAHGGRRARGMRFLVPAAARRSRRIIAVSQSTCNDLVQLLGLDPGEIDVVPQGVRVGVRESPPPEREVRERYELGTRKVVLSLSAKRPHKNLHVLIEAVARIPAERRPVVVIPGYPTWYETELKELARDLSVAADVRFPGWVEGREVEGLWSVASAFVYPSLYEGFGLPVLEAMARGIPVACSDVSSLPEVAGDAALLFEPNDTEAIAAAIERLLGDPAEAERLRAAGRGRVREFSWQRTARLTLETYARATSAA